MEKTRQEKTWGRPLPPPRVRIALIRHGESPWNADGILQGHEGPGLSERGRHQAAALAGHLAQHFGDATMVLTSDLDRARQTAEHVVAGQLNVPMRPDKRLRESDIGHWSGKTLHEVAQTDAQGLRAWLAGEDVRRGGGETKVQMLTRVLAALDEAVREVRAAAVDGNPGSVLVVTHGGPIRLAAAAMLGLFPSGYRPLEPPLHTSVTVLQVDDINGTAVTGRLETYNETSHVAALVDHGVPGLQRLVGS